MRPILLAVGVVVRSIDTVGVNANVVLGGRVAVPASGRMELSGVNWGGMALERGAIPGMPADDVAFACTSSPRNLENMNHPPTASIPISQTRPKIKIKDGVYLPKGRCG